MPPVSDTGRLLPLEDAQALTLADQGFDAVLCNMGLMYLPDPARGLAEFRRVLRPEGRVAVSVFTRGDRALVGGLVRAAIARRDPAKAAEAAHFYSAGEERRLHALFEGAGLREVETAVETLRFAYANFADFFGVERGEGAMGQEYTALPEEVRRAIREEVCREVGDAGGPVEVEVRIASGKR